RLERGLSRNARERPTVEAVVAMPVAPVPAQPGGDADLPARRDRHVAQVEEGVEFLAEEEPVPDVIAPRTEVGLAVGGVEDGLRPLPGDRAAATVSVEEARPEGSLTDPLPRAGEDQLSLVHLEGLELGREVFRLLHPVVLDLHEESRRAGRVVLRLAA